MTTTSHVLPNLKADLAEIVLSNPKTQALVATGTTGLAIDLSVMSWLPQTLSLVATSLGIVLTSLMIYSKWQQIKKDRKQTKKDKNS